jgi:hypothetical protein
MGRKADAENPTAAAASSLSDLKSNSHFLERMRLRKEVSLPDSLLKFRLRFKGFQLLAAMITVPEIGALQRFGHPRKLIERVDVTRHRRRWGVSPNRFLRQPRPPHEICRPSLCDQWN